MLSLFNSLRCIAIRTNCRTFWKTAPMLATTRTSRLRSPRETPNERLRRLRSLQNQRLPCYSALRRTKYKCFPPTMNRDDPCVHLPCPARIDASKYRPSDKDDCNYRRTWNEFKMLPTLSGKVRKIYPKIERRDPKTCQADLCTAREPEDCVLPKSPRRRPPKLFEPRTLPILCCPIPSPNCRSSRRTIKCTSTRLPSCCVKPRTPFPSYSECRKPPLLPSMELCECDRKPGICDMWNYWRLKR